MAIPANYDINYYRGDTYLFYLQPKDVNGLPLDVSTYTANFTIANYRGPDQSGDGGPLLVSYDATVALDGTTVTCTITPAIGSYLSGGTVYVYDVNLNKDGDVHTYLTGNIYVTDNVVETP